MARKLFLEYVWDHMIKPQIGYSFSIPHDIGYSIEALQEANLFCRYSPLFWQCACLSVNAGSASTSMTEDYEEGDEEEIQLDEEETKKKTLTVDYGKVARAVNSIRKNGAQISLPDINKAESDFIPDLSSNSILYSLQAVTNVNPDLTAQIISARSIRPFSSLEDFIARINPTNLQMISLIKAGAFDSLYPNVYRKAIMNQYMDIYASSKVKPSDKEKLTMTDFKKMIELKIVPKQFNLAQRIMKFKQWVNDNELDKENKRYMIKSEASLIFFKDYYENQLTIGKDCDIIPTGYSVKQSAFKKVTDSYLKELEDFLKSGEAKESLYKAKKEEVIKEQALKYLQGSVSKWEMDSLHYYYHDHELKHIMTSLYKIKDFDTLPEDPVVLKTKANRQGVEIPVYDTCSIAGTVINADNNKHIVTLLTHCGTVVDVKFYQGSYIFYNKTLSRMVNTGKKKPEKEVVEKSWFERGNLLLIHGFRRELSFVPRSNYDAGFKHSVAMITEVSDKGVITLKTEREEI